MKRREQFKSYGLRRRTKQEGEVSRQNTVSKSRTRLALAMCGVFLLASYAIFTFNDMYLDTREEIARTKGSFVQATTRLGRAQIYVSTDSRFLAAAICEYVALGTKGNTPDFFKYDVGGESSSSPVDTETQRQCRDFGEAVEGAWKANLSFEQVMLILQAQAQWKMPKIQINNGCWGTELKYSSLADSTGLETIARFYFNAKHGHWEANRTSIVRWIIAQDDLAPLECNHVGTELIPPETPQGQYFRRFYPGNLHFYEIRHQEIKPFLLNRTPEELLRHLETEWKDRYRAYAAPIPAKNFKVPGVEYQFGLEKIVVASVATGGTLFLFFFLAWRREQQLRHVLERYSEEGFPQLASPSDPLVISNEEFYRHSYWSLPSMLSRLTWFVFLLTPVLFLSLGVSSRYAIFTECGTTWPHKAMDLYRRIFVRSTDIYSIAIDILNFGLLLLVALCVSNICSWQGLNDTSVKQQVSTQRRVVAAFAITLITTIGLLIMLLGNTTIGVPAMPFIGMFILGGYLCHKGLIIERPTIGVIGLACIAITILPFTNCSSSFLFFPF